VTRGPAKGRLSPAELHEGSSCGRRLDEGSSTVSLNEISTLIKKKPAGVYTVYYFINGIPKGTTGETDGTLTFSVKQGRRCR
jgi:hypothetical protein